MIIGAPKRWLVIRLFGILTVNDTNSQIDCLYDDPEVSRGWVIWVSLSDPNVVLTLTTS